MLARLSRSDKKDALRVCISFGLLVIASSLVKDFRISLGIFLLAYIIIAYEVVLDALHGIRNGQIFDENFLMAIATIGALVLGEYAEAIFVMIFYTIGEIFESVAVGSSRKSIQSLIEYRPDEARVLRDGKEIILWPDEVEIGEEIIAYVGEKVPLDGIVVEGRSSLDQAFLTGESLPVDVKEGDEIASGSINLSGVLTIRTQRSFDDSTVSRIIDMIESSSDKKSETERFITKFSRYYTPLVVFAALGLAIIPNLILGGGWQMWVERALIFLVVSCPCALVISVPLSFFGGIGKAAKSGILVKGSNYLEVLADIDGLAFDKTGTITKGNFYIGEIEDASSVGDWLGIASSLESYSNHPIAKSLVEEFGSDLEGQITQVEEVHGHGMKGLYNGLEVLVGNDLLMDKNSISYPKTDHPYTKIYVAIGGTYQGSIVIRDQIKEDSKDAIESLKDKGIKDFYLLTGDKDQVASLVADQVGINHTYANLLPEDKVKRLEDIMEKTEGPLAYVGDGINDAPVIRRSDVGIAMGALGSDMAIEQADIVLMEDKLSKIVEAIDISQKTLKIAKENIVISLVIKFVVLGLAAVGKSTMWMAIFADTGVMLVAVLNSLRTMK